MTKNPSCRRQSESPLHPGPSYHWSTNRTWFRTCLTQYYQRFINTCFQAGMVGTVKAQLQGFREHLQWQHNVQVTSKVLRAPMHQTSTTCSSTVVSPAAIAPAPDAMAHESRQSNLLERLTVKATNSDPSHLKARISSK